MKNITLTTLLFVVLTAASVSCKKNSAHPGSTSGLPYTTAPDGLAGNWASGYVSMTQVIDVYTGDVVGNAWQSGKFFKITPDGKNAEFYYSAETQYMQSATKATGTIAFDAGSTSAEGSFTFYAAWAHYNGWGTTTVDRDATKDELSNNLTSKYYYKMEGQWLRIEPKTPVNDYSSSFEQIN